MASALGDDSEDVTEHLPQADQAQQSDDASGGVAVKGIVLVHGMGDPPKGEALYRWVNPIAEYVTRRQGHEPTISASMVGPDTKEPWSVTLEVGPASEGPPGIVTGRRQRWVFVEAWWARSFPEAKFDPALAWTATRMLRHLASMAMGMGRYLSLAFTMLLLYPDLVLRRSLSRAPPLLRRGALDLALGGPVQVQLLYLERRVRLIQNSGFHWLLLNNFGACLPRSREALLTRPTLPRSNAGAAGS